MIKKGILAFLCVVCCVATTWAYNFAATVPSGQTLYFSLVEGGVEVVYPMSGNAPANGWGSLTRPSGALTIPATVQHDGTDYAVRSVGNFAFLNCTGLTSLTIEEGVDSVKTSSFRGCSGLVALRLPASLQWAGVQAFADCASLTDVWVARMTPPNTGTSVFYGIPFAACTLHVGCHAVDAYAAAELWNGFGTVQGEGCTVTIGARANDTLRGSVSGGGIYPVGDTATLLPEAADGWFFVCWHDGDTSSPRRVQALSDSVFMALFFAIRYDTVRLEIPVHDTVVDTVRMVVPVHDTVWQTIVQNDTIEVHDTLLPTFFTLRVLTDNAGMGVGVGSAVLPAGTEAEVCGLPLEGFRFVAWEDGPTDNPRRVTITGGLTLKALFERLSVTSVEGQPWQAEVQGHCLTVRCEGDEWLRIYDLQGRQLLQQKAGSCTKVMLPDIGVYLVQVGDGPAKKIVIGN